MNADPLSRLSSGQRAMLADGCPLPCLLPRERAQAMPGPSARAEPRPFPALPPHRAEDPSTAAVRREAEERAAAERERVLAKKRDDEAIRRRALKNAALVARGVATPEPVKITKVTTIPAPPKPAPEGAQQETDMPKKPKKTATRRKLNPKLLATHPANRGKQPPKQRAAKGAMPKAPKAAKTDGTKTVRPGSKLEIVVGLLTRQEGCTAADVLKATEWPAVSMPQQARAAGLTLRQEKEGKTTRYWGTAA